MSYGLNRPSFPHGRRFHSIHGEPYGVTRRYRSFAGGSRSHRLQSWWQTRGFSKSTSYTRYLSPRCRSQSRSDAPSASSVCCSRTNRPSSHRFWRSYARCRTRSSLSTNEFKTASRKKRPSSHRSGRPRALYSLNCASLSSRSRASTGTLQSRFRQVAGPRT